MLNKAMSLFPALRETGLLNLKCGTVPLPEAVADRNTRWTL